MKLGVQEMRPEMDELDQNELDAWPNCATPDCENKCCRILGSDLCSPCSARRARVTMDEWRERITQKRISLGWPVD